MADRPAGVPLLVRLDGQAVMCIGAGRVAASKALPLAEAGARLTFVAPEAAESIQQAATVGRVAWRRRGWHAADLDGSVLAIAATASAEVNAEVAAAAAQRSIWCIRVDAGDAGTAALMATVRRGPLLLGVSTSGASPALARHVRARLATDYGPEWGDLAELLAGLRADPHVQAALQELSPDERAARWRAVLDTDILGMLRTGHPQRAKDLALSCLLSSSA